MHLFAVACVNFNAQGVEAFLQTLFEEVRDRGGGDALFMGEPNT